MADKLTFSVGTAANPDALVATRGTAEFEFGARGIRKIAGHGGFETITDTEAKAIYNELLNTIRKNPSSIPKDVVKILPDAIVTVPKTGPRAPLPEARAFAEELVEKAASIGKRTSEAQLKEIAKTHPGAFDLLTEKQTKHLGEAEHDLAALKATAKTEMAKATKLGELKAEFGKIIDVDVPAKGDLNKMEKFLQANGEHLNELGINEATRTKFPILKTLQQRARSAEPLMKRLNAQHEIIANHPDSKVVKAAEDEVKEIKKALDKIYDPKFGKKFEAAIKSHLPKELAAETHAHSPAYGVAADDAAKSASKWKFRNVILKSDAAEKGLKGFKAVHWGKAAGWVVGLGIVSHLAGLGGKRENPDVTNTVLNSKAEPDQQKGPAMA